MAQQPKRSQTAKDIIEVVETFDELAKAAVKAKKGLQKILKRVEKQEG